MREGVFGVVFCGEYLGLKEAIYKYQWGGGNYIMRIFVEFFYNILLGFSIL
jgi:hypothetical protein